VHIEKRVCAPIYNPQIKKAFSGATLPKSKEARPGAEANLKKREMQAQEGAKAWAEYQAQPRAVADKTERLRALRLAKETAAEATAGKGGMTMTATESKGLKKGPRGVLASRRR
jgi:hypothetical protein